MNINDTVRVSFRDFSINNIADLKNRLSSVQWFTNQNDVNLMAKGFIDKFDNLYNECFPVKVKFVGVKRFKKPWITGNILRCINKKHHLGKLVRASLCSKAVFNKYKNTLTLLIRNCKKFSFSINFISHIIMLNLPGNLLMILLVRKRVIMEISSLR